jgi:hypothetical protein
MSLWNPIQFKTKPFIINFGKGLNTYNDPLTLSYDELTDSNNMCADDYPLIRTRNDRVKLGSSQLTGVFYGIGQRSNTNIHMLRGTNWSHFNIATTAWTDITTGIVSAAPANFIEFNTQAAKYTIMAYSTGGVYNSYWDGTTYSTFGDTNCPRSNLFTGHRYRLYAVDSNKRTLRYSAQGLITDWTTADDAGYIDITGIEGGVTCITTFADHVIVWGLNSMHELYGTGPDNFELINISYVIGCVGRNAYTEAQGRLYWLDYSGIRLYSGGLPKQIAYQAKKYIDGINWDYKELIYAGYVDNKVYFGIPYKSTKVNKFIVIDIIEGSKGNTHTVNIEDGEFLGLTNAADKLYGINTDYIWNMYSTQKTGCDNSTAFSWNMETRPFVTSLDREFAVRDVWIEHSGMSSATAEIGYTTQDNSTTYTQIAASSDLTHSTYSSKDRVILGLTHLQQQSYAKFQLKGTGHKKISGLGVNVISYGDVI